jgi:hypothetical protein
MILKDFVAIKRWISLAVVALALLPGYIFSLQNKVNSTYIINKTIREQFASFFYF